MKFRLQTKLLLYFLSTSLVAYIIAFGYLSYNDHVMAIEEATKLTDTYSENYANSIMIKLDGDMNIARTLVQSFQNFKWVYQHNMEYLYYGMLRNVLQNNQQFHNAALNFELNAINPSYKKSYGRLRSILFEKNGQIHNRIDTLELTGDIIGSPYYSMKINPREDLSEPYYFSPTGKDEDLTLISSISIPILDEEKYVGLLQFDVNLERFKQMIAEIKPYEGSYGFLVSNQGAFIAHPNAGNIKKTIQEINPQQNIDYHIMENIQQGKSFSYMRSDSGSRKDYVSFYPVTIGKSKAYWALGIVTPFNVMIHNANANFKFSVIVAIVGFFLLALVIWLVSQNISNPLIKSSELIHDLANGNISLDKKLSVDRNDEIADIRKSVNSLIDSLDNNLKFAVAIGKGNLNYPFELLSEDDLLGKALINMRKSLKQAQEEEAKRKAEDEKLNWATKGAAIFADLMTSNTDNLSEFSYTIISNLIKYLDATQGGLFIINDDNKSNVFIELQASYAYNRRKFMDKKIPMGVGLVGRCIKEAETIYMTDFPEDYLNISSGLGDAKPKSLVIVPIIFNQQVFGVIEIASIHTMEDYQLQFIERIGGSIASTVSNVKINQQTARLLEESKIQSEELVSQEEETRQNMEEMKTTQEELERKTEEFSGVINALNSVALVAEFDMQGKVININNEFLRLLNKSKDEVMGKYQGFFADISDENKELFRNFWKDLRKGKIKKNIQQLNIDDKNIWLSEAYTPILDKNGDPYKVLNISVNITAQMQENL